MATGFNSRNALTVGSVTIVIAIELLAAAVAFAWAMSGILELGTTLALGLLAVCLALAGWGIWAFLRSALKTEPVHGGETPRG
jgi:putative Mn2+ efflux pump MntP